LQFLLVEMGFHGINVDLALKLFLEIYQRRCGTTLTFLQDSSQSECKRFLESFHLNQSRSVVNLLLQEIKRRKLASLLGNRLYNLKHNTRRRRAGFALKTSGISIEKLEIYAT
jgi:hypothetical protein